MARNRGVQEAEAPIVLFSQDDIFLAPDACEKHLEAHNRMQNAKCRMQNSAVLGFTTWDPACDITPVMKWLEESGWQFGYPLIEHYKQQMIPKKSQHRFTYTSHISVPTRIALEFPFREDVTQYGWEDISWGEELRKDGIELYYEHEAKALHHHHISLEDSLKRMEGLGRSIKNFRESDRFPPMWKQMAYKILIALQPNSFASKHRKAFLKGLQS